MHDTHAVFSKDGKQIGWMCKTVMCPVPVPAKNTFCEICQKERDARCKQAIEADRLKQEQGS